MHSPAMLQTLLIWIVFASIPPLTSTQSCFKANESQCDNVDFAPGSDLAGHGFDITTMKRKRTFVIDMTSWLQEDKSCTMCKNPYMGGQMQKIPVSVKNWGPRQKCKTKMPSSVYQSSEALVSSSFSSFIENYWKSDLAITHTEVHGSLILAGSKSKLAEYAMEKSKKDKFSFTTHDVSCEYYRYKVSTPPRLHPELVNEFKNLPKTYNTSTKQHYYNLIDRFGTHYITKVTLGGRVHSVTSFEDCELTLRGLTVDEVKRCLDEEVALSVGTAVKQAAADYCKQAKNKGFSNCFKDRETYLIGGHTQSVDLLFSSKNNPKAYKEWVSSLPAHPDVISYSLEPLHELLQDNEEIQPNLHNAIMEYILERGLLRNCTGPCKTAENTNPQEPCQCTCHNVQDVAPNCCPSQRGFAEVTVTVNRATDLYGDAYSETDGYVKVLLNGTHKGQTNVIDNNDSPSWNATISLGNMDITQVKSVNLEVWDEDNSSDDLLGACTIQLKLGVEQNSCKLDYGTLYYEVQVKCVLGLSGSSCMEHKPSPMEAELEKVYVSRNARKIPRDMLLEMGVLLTEGNPHFNHSNFH